MTKNQLLRVIAFCLLVCMMFVFLCDLFEQENNSNTSSRFLAYRTYPKDTVDAIYIGSSGVDRYWMAPKAYEEYGMTVYPLAADAMPPWIYTSVIEYALEYHDPKLVIVDVRSYSQSISANAMDVRARRVLDAMAPFSRVWFGTAFKAMSTIHKADPERSLFDVSLLLSFVRYHSKWEGATLDFFKDNLGKYVHKYNGFFVNSRLSRKVEIQRFQQHSEERSPAEEIMVEAFYELLAYTEKKGLELLFVDTPQMQQPQEASRSNYMYDLIAQEGCECLHWFTDRTDGSFSIPLDPEKHFYNAGHVNFEGAEIFTEYLAAYLHENYQLPDRRQDNRAKPYWDGVYDRLKEDILEFPEIVTVAEEESDSE